MGQISVEKSASPGSDLSGNQQTDTTNRPSHYVYAVRKGSKGGKGFWTRIGAAWANRDGEGFSVKLDLVPLDGADIVIRTPRDEQARDEREEGGAA